MIKRRVTAFFRGKGWFNIKNGVNVKKSVGSIWKVRGNVVIL